MGLATIGSVLAISDGAACRKEHAKEKKELGVQLINAHASVPKKEVGRKIEAGACTIRALRLGLKIGQQREFESVVEAVNFADCIAVRIYEIDQECACRASGDKYAPELENDMFEIYRDVRRIEKLTLSAGIKNTVLRKYIRDVSATKNCVSVSSLRVLQDIHKKIKDVNP